MLSPSIFLSGVWLQAAPALVLEILHRIKQSVQSTVRRMARSEHDASTTLARVPPGAPGRLLNGLWWSES
jgi:hypothetical protein